MTLFYIKIGNRCLYYQLQEQYSFYLVNSMMLQEILLFYLISKLPCAHQGCKALELPHLVIHVSPFIHSVFSPNISHYWHLFWDIQLFDQILQI